MSNESTIKEILDEWVVSQQSEDDDLELGLAVEADDETEEEIDEGNPVDYTSTLIRLGDYELDEIKRLKVSPDSSFGDLTWDFCVYPSAGNRPIRINFGYKRKEGIDLSQPSYEKLLLLVQALLFYRIPHVNPAGRVRSYSSLLSDHHKIFRIAAFCVHCGVYDEFSGFSVNSVSSFTVERYIADLESDGKRWEFCYMLRYWHEISRQGMLPSELSLMEDLVTAEQVSSYRSQYDSQSSPYVPLPLDDYAAIFNHCALMVESYAEDCLWLYQTYKHVLVGALDYPDRLPRSDASYLTNDELGVAAFRAYSPTTTAGSPWWPLSVLKKVSEEQSGEYIRNVDIVKTIVSLIDACSLLILCVTGMRRSELISLKADCLSEDKQGSWLSYYVFKTSVASQGDLKRIPIPSVAAKAIRILITLGHESREYGGHDYLFSKFWRTHFGKQASIAALEHSCRRVAAAVGIDQNLHAHRFRKSLAMYIIHQDPRNIEVIRKLFSHASLRMTLKYILSLPGVNEEVKRVIVEENSEILSVVLRAVLEERIGGIGGRRILRTAEQSPILKAKLQNEGKESLSQYVASLLDEGVKLLHRTSMAICLKTVGLTSFTPCDPKNGVHEAKLHPNIFACDPFNCRFAAFVEENVPALENEIIFHNNMLKHDYSSASQKNFSQQRIKEAHMRMSEVIGEAADAFLRKVASG